MSPKKLNEALRVCSPNAKRIVRAELAYYRDTVMTDKTCFCF